jgi:hypothetical protein
MSCNATQCMYPYIYASMRLCIYASTYACVHACMHVCVYVITGLVSFVCRAEHISCTCKKQTAKNCSNSTQLTPNNVSCPYIYTCIYIYMYIYIHMYIFMHIYYNTCRIHIYTHILYRHMYIYNIIYTCIILYYYRSDFKSGLIMKQWKMMWKHWTLLPQLVNVSRLKDFSGGSHLTTKHLLLEPQSVKI